MAEIESRKVIIKRKRPNSTRLPDELLYQRKTPLSFGIDHKVGKKIEMKLLQDIFKCDPEVERERWWKESESFWNNLRVNVDERGHELEIGCNKDETEFLNPKDYAIYLAARDNHPQVAKNEDDELDISEDLPRFYIHDPELEEKATYAELQTKKDSKLAFMTLVDEKKKPQKLDQVLKVFNANHDLKLDIGKMSREKKEIELDRLSEKYPAEFLKVTSDKELEAKADISSALSVKILEKHGNKIYYHSEYVGDSIENAVKWYNDPNNSDNKMAIRAKIDQSQRVPA